jgi:hypothetical protein
MNLKCPQCNYVNKGIVNACGNCGVLFSVQPKKKSNWGIILAVIAIALIGLVIVICSPIFLAFDRAVTETQEKIQKEEITKSNRKLKVLSIKDTASETGNYISIVGEVQNLSPEKLEFVKANISLYNKNGDLINTESTYLELNPVMPNQVSSFKKTIRARPDFDTYRVNFVDRSGESIFTENVK